MARHVRAHALKTSKPKSAAKVPPALAQIALELVHVDPTRAYLVQVKLPDDLTHEGLQEAYALSEYLHQLGARAVVLVPRQWQMTWVDLTLTEGVREAHKTEKEKAVLDAEETEAPAGGSGDASGASPAPTPATPRRRQRPARTRRAGGDAHAQPSGE